jgi:hypothetical protein
MGMYPLMTRVGLDILMVSLSFQLPAMDGFGTALLIFNVNFFLSTVKASFTAFVSKRPDLEAAAAGGAEAR